MGDTVWTTRVELQLRAGGRFVVVTGPSAAWKLLTTRWPVTSGKAFWAAQEVCLAALDNRNEQEDARIAFMAAAKEAGLTIR